MTSASVDQSSAQIPQKSRRPLRLWPGVVIVAVQWLVGLVLPRFVPEAGPLGAMVALAGGLAVFVWWAFFSRAPGVERWGAVALMIIALISTRSLLHESIRRGGMGMVFFIYAIPVLCLAFVVWAVTSRRLAVAPRRTTMVATILLACGAWTLLQTGGVTGAGSWDWAWRWAETHEDRLLAETDTEPAARPVTEAAVTAPLAEPAGRSPLESNGEFPAQSSSAAQTQPATELAPEFGISAVIGSGETEETGVEWPGFRGPHRDAVVHGTRIATDWSASPPHELWHRPIGPGWSSFAVDGDLVYTQEQRGDEEMVSCYSAITGEAVWKHSDVARFWEPQAGAGPRATPTLNQGRVYTFGATGILNALDAADGSVIWTRNAASDNKAAIPGWGFSSSPLVVGDLVVVGAGPLAAYDLATGAPRWSGPTRGSYSSPHLLTVDGVAQIVQLSGSGAAGVAPADGSVLWEHAWPGGIVQPAITADGDILLSGGGMTGGTGLRRVAVAQLAGVDNAEHPGFGGWTVDELWTSNRLKPNFNDFVVHKGHAFGFDGSILASVDVENGERKWKGGRYGNGQLVLLAEQDLLLVLSEQGDLALVEAVPDRFSELARIPAIEGKTWNHPVLLGDLLLVRNGQEMAAFRLALAGS